MKRMRSGKSLARHYGLHVKDAYSHSEGNWFWNLNDFPGAYFDAYGVVVFQSEGEYSGCVYLSIGPRNTWVRNKAVGMSISDIPGYRRLNPPPRAV